MTELDLSTSYSYQEYRPDPVMVTITPEVRERTLPSGAHRIRVRGLAPFFADRFNAIADEGDRIHCLTLFRSAEIVIFDRDYPEWDGMPRAREHGRLRTTYMGEVPGITVDDVLDLADRLRAQLMKVA